MLEILASYHRIHFQGKLVTQTQKIAKNLILGLINAHWAQIQTVEIFL